MIRSVREWTHSPDKGSWGKELRDAEALFLCKKICYNGKNQLEAGHCSPTAQRWLVCVKSFDRVKLSFSSTFSKRWWCPEATPLAAFRRRRNTLSVKAPLRVNFSIQNLDWKRGGTLLSSGAFEEVWNPFAREKGSKNWLQVQTIPEKFPVGSFRQ